MKDIEDFVFCCKECGDILDYDIKDDEVLIYPCRCKEYQIELLECDVGNLQDDLDDVEDFENLKKQIINNCATNLDKINKQYEFMFNKIGE